MASHDSVEEKMKTARGKKDLGDQAFKGGKITEGKDEQRLHYRVH
jgi:hypothetical protein